MNTRAMVGVAIGAAFFLLLLILFVIFLVPAAPKSDRVAATDALVETALNGDTIDNKEQAAVDLARSPDPAAPEAMRSVLEKSKDARVMIAVVQGLGYQQDRDSLPQLLKIIKDEKIVDDPNDAKLLRGRAAVAILKIIEQEYGWNIEADQTDEQLTKFDNLCAATDVFIKTPPPVREKKRK